MPNWGDVLEEIRTATPEKDQSPFDLVRRKYLKELSDYTGRNTIAYYSGFLAHPRAYGTAINDDDKNGLMLCCHQIDKSKGLDLILHTPGGNLYATDSLINYIKQMFGQDVRAIVPQIAMSAGTMIAVTCKSIVLGKHSNLGPIDPQINGLPAYAIKEQFQQAYGEIKTDPRVAPIWAPMLSQLGISFLKQCDWAMQYAEDFVVRELGANMLQHDPDVATKAPQIAEKLADLGENKSHERRFHYTDCQAMGLNIEMLEDDQNLQDLVLTVHHCYMHVLGGIIKIIENQSGKAQVKLLPQTQQNGLTLSFGGPPT